MGRIIILVALVALLVAPRVVRAQLAVAEAGPMLGQIALEVARTLELVNLAVRDLAPLSQIGDAMAVAADLQAIMTEVNIIATAMQGRQNYWTDSGNLPTAARMLAEMRRLHTQLCLTSSTQGLRAQVLAASIPRLLDRLTSLLSELSRMLGSVAGLQAANAVLGGISGQLALLMAAMTSAHEPQLCEIWRVKKEAQALESVTAHLVRDYGRWAGRP